MFFVLKSSRRRRRWPWGYGNGMKRPIQKENGKLLFVVCDSLSFFFFATFRYDFDIPYYVIGYSCRRIFSPLRLHVCAITRVSVAFTKWKYDFDTFELKPDPESTRKESCGWLRLRPTHNGYLEDPLFALHLNKFSNLISLNKSTVDLVSINCKIIFDFSTFFCCCCCCCYNSVSFVVILRWQFYLHLFFPFLIAVILLLNCYWKT